MSKEYYTIIREHYGFPDYINTDLSEKEDCFAFIRSVKRINVYEIYSKMANGWRMKGMEK